MLPGTCGQWKHEVSAEQSESTSFPGVRKQLNACKWEPKCDMSHRPTAEISHAVLIQAHTVTPQSYALLQQACTHRSNRQRIISKSKNSSLIRVCSLHILETIRHKEIIYWQNTNFQISMGPLIISRLRLTAQHNYTELPFDCSPDTPVCWIFSK